MKIFTNINDIRDIQPTALALGKFDGVHLGHASLIRRAIRHAKEHGLRPAVFTFSNHPYNVIAGRALIGGIATERDKKALLESLGVEYLFSFEFDERFHEMAPRAFIGDMLLGAFRAGAVFCGFNFRFGAEAAGDSNLLRDAGAESGFDVEVMEPYRVGDTLVSSTVIRDLIADGSMEEAARYLGRPFSIVGEIARGNGIGRGLGFPTANIPLPKGVVVPAYGVYVTESEIIGSSTGGAPCDETSDDMSCSKSGDKPVDDMSCSKAGATRWMRSVTNIGVRPTVGDSRLLAETHVFGAPDEDLYGHRLRVNFLSMLRPEKKFAGLDELKTQVEIDKRSALAWR